MTETAHTPLPWEAQVLETENDPGVYIVGSNLGGLVCAALPWPTEIESGDYSRVEANAAFIVHAVNSHHDLIEALRECGQAIEVLFETADDRITGVSCIALDMLKDAAKNARAILTKTEAGR